MTLLPPLSARQRVMVWILGLICASSRFLARARSMWDWDEALFCLGMRDYDVTLHHPHPPGFPVYLALGRVLRWIIPGDFQALQALNLAAGMLAFPAIFFLARQLRLRFETALAAALLFVFLPNVWFFGGGAFSDVPSIVLVVTAVLFLLRGRDSRADYLCGTFLLALAIGIRPQNLLIGLYPGLSATVRRSWRDIVAALFIGVAVTGIAYGGAIHASGNLHDYLNTVRAHGDYIARIDSFRAPGRPPLWRLFDRFFVKQYQNPALSIITSLLVAISVVGAIRHRDRRLLENALIFGPFALGAWMMLDRFSINRFSIGYAPMFAIFAADGLERLSRKVAGMSRSLSTPPETVHTVLAGTLALAFIFWTAPALRAVRNDVAPPVLAVQTAARTLDPHRDRLFVAYSMTPFIEYLAPAFPITRVMDDRAIPLTSPASRFLLAEAEDASSGGQSFRRKRDRLWNVARRHYFEVTLRPLTSGAQFGAGWYPPEQVGMDEWRWMSSRSTTLLPPAKGDTVLRLNFAIPEAFANSPPMITVRLNGETLERFQALSSDVSRDYHVNPLSSPNVMELSTDRTAPDGRAGRDLGLRVRFISWGPN